MTDMLPSDDAKKLAEEIRALRATVQKSIAWKYIILRGLVSGVATAIGATIIATILIIGLIQLVKSIGLSDWFATSGLQQFLQREP